MFIYFNDIIHGIGNKLKTHSFSLTLTERPFISKIYNFDSNVKPMIVNFKDSNLKRKFVKISIDFNLYLFHYTVLALKIFTYLTLIWLIVTVSDFH